MDLWASHFFSPKKNIVEEINGNGGKLYKSIGTTRDTTEYIPSIELAGVSPQRFQLKVGIHIIFIRYLCHSKFCNWIQLSVQQFLPNVIKANILIGVDKKEDMPGFLKFQQTFILNSMIQFPVRFRFLMIRHKENIQTTWLSLFFLWLLVFWVVSPQICLYS